MELLNKELLIYKKVKKNSDEKRESSRANLKLSNRIRIVVFVHMGHRKKLTVGLRSYGR